MKVKLDENAHVPTRSYRTDAGLDLYALEGGVIPHGGYKVFKTGVHVQIPEGYYGRIAPRSGFLMKGMITDGIIDAAFRGDIRVSILNLGDADKVVEVGDRIAQLVITPFLGVGLEVTDELDSSDRGANGYGSTGR